MELNLVIQLAIFTGIFTVISGVVIQYVRKWYPYWRQVFLISAMEKQRSGGDQRSHEAGQGVERFGAPYWISFSAICCGLLLLAYKSVFNAAAIVYSFANYLSLKVFVTGP
jgi:hypothetical protein